MKPRFNLAGSDTGCLSHREIARRLGISHGQVMNIERRALQKLRKLILKGVEPDARSRA